MCLLPAPRVAFSADRVDRMHRCMRALGPKGVLFSFFWLGRVQSFPPTTISVGSRALRQCNGRHATPVHTILGFPHTGLARSTTDLVRIDQARTIWSHTEIGFEFVCHTGKICSCNMSCQLCKHCVLFGFSALTEMVSSPRLRMPAVSMPNCSYSSASSM